MRIGWAALKRGRGRSGAKSASLRQLRLPWRWESLMAGFISLLALTLLNGEMSALPQQWLQRGLIAAAQVGLMVVLIRQIGLTRASGLALRSPIAPSAREVGLILLVLIGFLSLLGVRVVAALAHEPVLGSERGFLAFAPLLAGGMMLSTLIHPLLAVLTFTVLLGGIAVALELPVLTAGLVGLVGWSAMFAVFPMRRRTDLFLVGTLLSALLAVGSFAAELHLYGDWLKAGVSAFWGLISGTGAMAIFWLGLTLLERPFRLATPMALMELASLEHPLQRELRDRAPGTYFHSQYVGQLAEEAALAIGADPMLARVGGYYHDIGKLTRPDFYIENQRGPNTHERINPALSARIIASHVRDGVELAHQHRLPTAICDIIAQHHGTSLITYFYHQAVGEGHDPVLEQHFRYDGPKPQTREAALVMLADTVEAATRCLENPTPARLASYVHELIEMRHQDGQLDESTLTFRDLKLIEEAFVRVLVALRHRRVAYQDAQPEREEVYVANLP
ncbi:Cyclic-di-AMP phosphodiesterase PgpH [bacterium HR15]|nr:Cyclic-di-AMP phosphodiesterase PgpH [bacterium HR15]